MQRSCKEGRVVCEVGVGLEHSVEALRLEESLKAPVAASLLILDPQRHF
jgi:hypothetical protein